MKNNKRASGRTTKLIDEYVQKYFSAPTNTSIEITDHYNEIDSNKMLAQKIVNRLQTEHNISPIIINEEGNKVSIFKK